MLWIPCLLSLLQRTSLPSVHGSNDQPCLICRLLHASQPSHSPLPLPERSSISFLLNNFYHPLRPPVTLAETAPPGLSFVPHGILSSTHQSSYDAVEVYVHLFLSPKEARSLSRKGETLYSSLHPTPIPSTQVLGQILNE